MNQINVFLDNVPLISTITFTYRQFLKDIKNKKSIINTTILEAIDSKYYQMGYDIQIFDKNKSIKFSDILNGEHTTREIRLSHDWRKLLLNGEFSNWKELT